MRGGKRPGSGRKPTLKGERQFHGLKAFPEEWELIKEFSTLIKKGFLRECQDALSKLKALAN